MRQLFHVRPNYYNSGGVCHSHITWHTVYVRSDTRGPQMQFGSRRRFGRSYTGPSHWNMCSRSSDGGRVFTESKSCFP